MSGTRGDKVNDLESGEQVILILYPVLVTSVIDFAKFR